MPVKQSSTSLFDTIVECETAATILVEALAGLEAAEVEVAVETEELVGVSCPVVLLLLLVVLLVVDVAVLGA
jgi:hypothetical protein